MDREQLIENVKPKWKMFTNPNLVSAIRKLWNPYDFWPECTEIWMQSVAVIQLNGICSAFICKTGNCHSIILHNEMDLRQHSFSIFEFHSGLFFSFRFFPVCHFFLCCSRFYSLVGFFSLVLCWVYDRKKSHDQSEKLCAALVCTSHSDCNSLVSNRELYIFRENSWENFYVEASLGNFVCALRSKYRNLIDVRKTFDFSVILQTLDKLMTDE